ncbi:hypothetical protein CC80DRAFT_562875 [Byssothecium circinans]|uniref:Uncharacterized protein n=1 Tax=Byssothecium circinans TaxID=147558 RepID=A0A6A5TZR5_9PLEO|nr:hypothetical protein CC80DRAFT_562875 [Byssothecium circinans]
MVTPSPSKLVSPSFPPELLLKAIEHLPFNNGTLIQTLSITHPCFQSLLHIYERSITKSYSRRELPHAASDFPREAEARGFAWLSECVEKYDVVDEVMAQLTDEENCFKVERHNMGVVYTGMLLLYHLSSIEPHASKLTFLNTLPLHPLTALYLAVHATLVTARFHVPGSLLHHHRFGTTMDATTLSLRSDMDFAFSETCLQLGPAFMHSMLCAPQTAEAALLNVYHEFVVSDWDLAQVRDMEVKPPVTEGPVREEKEGSCWCALLGRVGALAGCEVGDVPGWVEERCEGEGHELAFLGVRGRRMLMAGRDLVDGDAGGW